MPPLSGIVTVWSRLGASSQITAEPLPLLPGRGAVTFHLMPYLKQIDKLADLVNRILSDTSPAVMGKASLELAFELFITYRESLP